MTGRRNLTVLLLVVILLGSSLILLPIINATGTAPAMGSAADFAILAGSTVTSTGSIFSLPF